MTRRRPTTPPLTRTEREVLDRLVRRGAGSMNASDGNHLIHLWQLDQADRERDRRSAGGAERANRELKHRAERAEADAARYCAAWASARTRAKQQRNIVEAHRAECLAQPTCCEVYDGEHWVPAVPCAPMFAAQVYKAIGAAPPEPTHNSYTFEDDGELNVSCEDCSAYSDNVGDHDDARRWAEAHKADPYGERS
ncbi:hypothetical protein [Kitasatospora sp. NPDC004289]